MKPLVLPFDYLPVDKACEWISSYIAPFSVAPDDVYLLWQQDKVALCLDWGSWYWPGVIIDLGGTRDRVHRGRTPLLPFRLSSKSDVPHDDEERAEGVERIARIIDALESRTSNFVMPECHSFKSAGKPIEQASTKGWGDRGYAYPMRRFRARPYGSTCEFFDVNIPLKKPMIWVGEKVNSVHPNWVHYKDCGLWDNYQGFEMEDLIIPAEEIQKLIAFYKPEQEFSDSENNDDITSFTKTLNYLAVALKALIHIQYGAETAENLRKYLDDPDSEISQDFINAGIKAPGGKALHNHLKGFVIEVLPEIEKVEVTHTADS